MIGAALTDVANVLRDAEAVDESERYINATFGSAKGGGEEIGPTRGGKGVTIMAIVDRHGLPLAVTTRAPNDREDAALRQVACLTALATSGTSRDRAKSPVP